jgi:hypothetical protein
MTSPNLRSTMAALDVARPLIVRLDERRHPEDAAADLIEGWAAVETALRAMIGGSSLGGQALVSEVRAQGLLDYPHAHALLGFLAARDRATRPDYQPTAEDVAAARAGFQAIEAANGSGIAADTGVHPSVRHGATPPGAVLPPPPPPTMPSRPARDPRAAGGLPPAGIVAGNATGNGGSTVPAGRDYARDASTAPPPLAGDLSDGTPRRRPSRALLLGGLALLLLALGAGGYLLWNRGRDPRTLAEGIGAYRDGRRDAARTAFERTIAERPNLAAPRVYLARLAREDGDVARATALLDTAIRLDTTNAVAYREMGQLQLQANRPQLAVSFFRRALLWNGTDTVANGWMGCALARTGQAALAENFYSRAGPGDWTACRQGVPQAGVPAAAAPGVAVPGGPGSYSPVAPGARQPLRP